MNLNVVLVNPEIPQNTGNVARTCAALGATLHLVEPLGFSLEDRYLKRAGVDYWPLVSVCLHPSVERVLELSDRSARFFATARGSVVYNELQYPDPCWLFFGPESTGLPDSLLCQNRSNVVRLPMREGTRSLNLSNAVAVLAYEVFRGHGFPGLQRAASGMDLAADNEVNDE